MKTRDKSMHKSTKAIHAGSLENSIFGEVSVPIFQSSTFSFRSVEEGAARFSGEQPGYIYTRMGNPTSNALEENLATLENGFKGMVTATGMAASTTINTISRIPNFMTILSYLYHRCSRLLQQ